MIFVATRRVFYMPAHPNKFLGSVAPKDSKTHRVQRPFSDQKGGDLLLSRFFMKE